MRARGVGGRYSCRYRLDMITLELSNIHTTFHKRSLCVFFQFSSALVQAAGSGWEEAVSTAPAPGPGAATPVATVMSPLEGQVAGLGGEDALSCLLALRVLHKAPEGSGSCVDTETEGQARPSSGTSLPLGNPFCSLPSQTRARGHYLLAAPGCSLSLMEHSSWDVALPARKVSPGQVRGG